MTGNSQAQLRDPGLSGLLQRAGCFSTHGNAAIEVIDLQTPLQQDNAVLLEKIAVLSKDIVVHRRLNLARAIIQLQYSHRSALGFDRPDIQYEAGHHHLTVGLKLADSSRSKFTHLGFISFHRVTTQKTAQTLFFCIQQFGERPWTRMTIFSVWVLHRITCGNHLPE